MPRIKIGDVIEIVTPKGLAYAQYINKHSSYGSLLRVFVGIHTHRPSDFDDVLAREVQFMCFFPLQAAINQKIVKVVRNAAIPDEASKFPIFRSGTVDPATGKVGVWWLWDEEEEWRVDSLTEEQRYFPIGGVWNDTILVERIISGWRPENDPST